jgi:hypothetical protein
MGDLQRLNEVADRGPGGTGKNALRKRALGLPDRVQVKALARAVRRDESNDETMQRLTEQAATRRGAGS